MEVVFALNRLRRFRFARTGYANLLSDLKHQNDFHGRGFIDLELAFTTISAAPLPGLDKLDLVLSPNPFSHQTEIAYSAPSRRSSSLEIFDLRGRLIRRLATVNRQSGVLSWDGKNSRGQSAATGTYLIVFKSGNEIRQEKALLVR